MKMPTAVIREEIREMGGISFARFMALALYCPESGYYEKKSDTVGRRGDFITSVSAGSLFGELLAFQFAEWFGAMALARASGAQTAGHRLVAEAGAHDGRLAADILTWLQTCRPAVFEQLEYVIVEPSPARQHWQQGTLAPFAPKVRWVAQLPELSALHPAVGTQRAFSGVLFANELLDAFPVHRLGWDAAERVWFEWGVGLDGERFCWQRRPLPVVARRGAAGRDARIPDRPSPPQCPPELEAVLPDGYTIEISPAAEQWWQEAARILGQGKLMTIDYGFTTEEQFSPARTRGTLRGYHRHQVTDDLLAQVGEQDLTAHVNFTAIQNAGEAAGLKTEQFCSQPRFLTRILQQAVVEKSFTPLGAEKVRQFQTLTHPEHLGRAFRVLVQGRSAP